MVKPIYGLVLAGGKSRRMKKDKASLKFHGKPQLEYAYELLQPYCQKVFVSSRKKSAKFPAIVDSKKFSDIGPLGGILSAMSKHPKASWLVLACDLPFVTDKTLVNLLSKRDPKKIATAYRSRFNDLPEPLCAVYEPKAFKNHLKFLKQGVCCPRKILINSKTKLLKLVEKRALDNINTPEEYKEAVRILKK